MLSQLHVKLFPDNERFFRDVMFWMFVGNVTSLLLDMSRDASLEEFINISMKSEDIFIKTFCLTSSVEI